MSLRAHEAKTIERVARFIHSAPARALREGLRQHPEGEDTSHERRIEVLYAELVALELACVDVARDLFELLGAEDVANGVHRSRDELLDMLDAARVSRRVCEGCGCTEFNACPNGCHWAKDDLCSRCADRTNRKRTGEERAARPRGHETRAAKAATERTTGRRRSHRANVCSR